MHYKVEKNATRKGFGRELSLEVFAVSINKTRTVLGTDAHSSVLHTIELCFKAGHYLPRGTGGGGLVTVIAIYILDRFVGFIDKFRHIGTIFTFFLVSLWSRGWRSDPTSVLPIGMPLSPITRATVVIFSELRFAVSLRFVTF